MSEGTRATMIEFGEVRVEAVTRDEPRYLSPELSLLRFNQRVLEQAHAAGNPLLERLKFLAISDTNLDEFLSLQLSALLGRVDNHDAEPTPDGLTQTQHLRRVREVLARFMREQHRVLDEELIPQLAAAGIHFRRYSELSAAQQSALQELFLSEVFPICTPLAVDPAHPFPFMSNMSINLGVVLWDVEDGETFARIKVPTVFPRLIRVPGDDDNERAVTFVWLEDIMANHLDAFFPGVEVRRVCLFRVLRDTGLDLADLDTADLRSSVQAGIRRRRLGKPVCVQLACPLDDPLVAELMARLDIHPEDFYVTGGPLGLRDLRPAMELDRPELKDPPLVPRVPAPLAHAQDFFTLIRRRDVLLYHPYEPFQAVVDFICQAAADPHVLAIKQTLYRVGRRSPLVQSLLDALDRGKQVAIVLELRAPGDEENNVEWAQTLERAGAHVSYGMIGLNTHGKLALVVRREPDGLRRYVHLGSGNYNANGYADLSLFTCHPEIGADVTELFNTLTGRSRRGNYSRLLVAPVTLRQGIVSRIMREIERHRQYGDGRIIIKNNALTDLSVIEALYRASQTGVQIDLIVRGMCSVRPGVPGLSERVRVVSVVGRFLEHSRVYYFHNGGDEELFVGSADLMDFSLDSRIDLVAPVLDPDLVQAVKAGVLELQLSDTVRTTELCPDGTYRAVSACNELPVDAQHLWSDTALSFMHPESLCHMTYMAAAD